MYVWIYTDLQAVSEYLARWSRTWKAQNKRNTDKNVWEKCLWMDLSEGWQSMETFVCHVIFTKRLLRAEVDSTASLWMTFSLFLQSPVPGRTDWSPGNRLITLGPSHPSAHKNRYFEGMDLLFQPFSTFSKDTINELIKLFHLIFHSTMLHFAPREEFMALPVVLTGLTMFLITQKQPVLKM